MAMVDRYKKSGGFIQLLQVIETCGIKKQEQFMSIIAGETPNWAVAIQQKMLTFDKILSWKSEALLEIIANINTLTFVTALKSLSIEKFNILCDKLSAQEKRKIDQQYKELNPDLTQISACIMKVVSETRSLFISGVLKYDKIEPQLIIPENFESQLENINLSTSISDKEAGGLGLHIGTVSSNTGATSSLDIEQLKKKYIEINQQLNLIKKENLIMKEKLEKIKKIA